MPTRRQFIKVGLGGAALFATVRFLDGPIAAPASPYRLLDEKSASFVKVLAPVVLAGALPEDAAARDRAVNDIAVSFDRAASGLAPSAQQEITDLFGFLDFAPTRLAFAGLWSPIGQSSAEELRAFLTRWRNSRFELQQASYQALTQLIQASWYDTPAAWAAISYPGPPPIATK